MFYVMGNLLIAKAKHLFTVIKIATSYDPSKNETTINDKTEDKNTDTLFDYISLSNLEFWISITESIIVNIAKKNKNLSVIHTEYFHRLLMTLSRIKYMNYDKAESGEFPGSFDFIESLS